ncbi:hypothetical protein GO491_00440 [Flavobacteriaceae bacterium Ap0902]|nr:hypothetical protein [Flavobacteriaceae bacterium Ap0902]
MQAIHIDNKKHRIEIKDQLSKIILFLRFIFILNILNTVVYYLVFYTRQDLLHWLWFAFALLNVYFIYFTFTKVSKQHIIGFDEIESVDQYTLIGLVLKLKNGMYRKIFIPSESEVAQKLVRKFNKS